jgi:SSS family solute:Na+ symporter
MLVIAIGARKSKSVFEAGLAIGSIPLGPLLGVFLLGVLTRKPRESSAIAGAVAGLGTIILVVTQTKIAFTWYVLIGTSVTFGVGWLFSLFEPPLPPEEVLVRQPVGGNPHLPDRRTTAEE